MALTIDAARRRRTLRGVPAEVRELPQHSAAATDLGPRRAPWRVWVVEMELAGCALIEAEAHRWERRCRVVATMRPALSPDRVLEEHLRGSSMASSKGTAPTAPRTRCPEADPRHGMASRSRSNRPVPPCPSRCSRSAVARVRFRSSPRRRAAASAPCVRFGRPRTTAPSSASARSTVHAGASPSTVVMSTGSSGGGLVDRRSTISGENRTSGRHGRVRAVGVGRARRTHRTRARRTAGTRCETTPRRTGGQDDRVQPLLPRQRLRPR